MVDRLQRRSQRCQHGLNIEFHGSTQGDEWLIADVRLAGESATGRG
jgi:hypothetical protein